MLIFAYIKGFIRIISQNGILPLHSRYSSEIQPSEMMLFAFVLSCVIAGSLACSNTHCKDPDLANQMLQVTFLPNKEELRTLCPKMMTFLECERNFMECPGQTLEQLANSSDKYDAAMAKGMLAGTDLVRDICDEDSSFHKDYVASVSCSRDYFIEGVMNCSYYTMKSIEDFFNQNYADAYEDEVKLTELRCLREAYEVTCVIEKLGDACGEVAKRTAWTGLQRMKDMLGVGSCKSLENAADLKSRFLDFLNLNEQRRSSVQGIFDLFKRRR